MLNEIGTHKWIELCQCLNKLIFKYTLIKKGAACVTQTGARGFSHLSHISNQNMFARKNMKNLANLVHGVLKPQNNKVRSKKNMSAQRVEFHPNRFASFGFLQKHLGDRSSVYTCKDTAKLHRDIWLCLTKIHTRWSHLLIISWTCMLKLRLTAKPQTKQLTSEWNFPTLTFKQARTHSDVSIKELKKLALTEWEDLFLLFRAFNFLCLFLFSHWGKSFTTDGAAEPVERSMCEVAGWVCVCVWRASESSVGQRQTDWSRGELKDVATSPLSLCLAAFLLAGCLRNAWLLGVLTTAKIWETARVLRLCLHPSSFSLSLTHRNTPYQSLLSLSHSLPPHPFLLRWQIRYLPLFR